MASASPRARLSNASVQQSVARSRRISASVTTAPGGSRRTRRSRMPTARIVAQTPVPAGTASGGTRPRAHRAPRTSSLAITGMYVSGESPLGHMGVQLPGDTWVWDLRRSFAPGVTSAFARAARHRPWASISSGCGGFLGFPGHLLRLIEPTRLSRNRDALAGGRVGGPRLPPGQLTGVAVAATRYRCRCRILPAQPGTG